MTPPAAGTRTRTEEFPCDGPAELDLQLGNGRIEVRVTDADRVRVELALEDEPAGGGERDLELPPGRASGDEDDPVDAEGHALAKARIEFAGERRRLIFRTPRALRRVGLVLRVEAPAGSRLSAATHRGRIMAWGTLCGLDVGTGSGDVTVERVDGDVEVRVGSGAVRLGRVAGRLRLRTGAGPLEVASLEGGGARLTSGCGDVRLGAVHSDVQARTGSGSIAVADAAAGRLDLATGTGDVHVAIRRGADAEVDVVSGSYRARSELEVAARPPSRPPSLRIRARTGAGDAVISRAAD